MKDRIYICHTFYHAYIALIKELNRPVADRGGASLMLSTMSNDFDGLKERAEASGLFGQVFLYDEQEDISFPQVMKYHTDKGNIVLNLLQRIRYTKALGRAEADYIPTDLTAYKDIYVFCDQDPIGYYLNYKHIHYHAVEDGLDTLEEQDDARLSNKGHFGLKAWMARHNLIFICNGYSRYCDDMEVNDLSVIKHVMPWYIEVPRSTLELGVAADDTHYLMDIFMTDVDRLVGLLADIPKDKRRVMILSDPVCDAETRRRIMVDIAAEYGLDAQIIIKQHPRDLVEYSDVLPEAIIIRDRFPMEILELLPQFHMDLVIGIWTVVSGIHFADKCIKLGSDFMDKYEDPMIHLNNRGI